MQTGNAREIIALQRELAKLNEEVSKKSKDVIHATLIGKNKITLHNESEGMIADEVTVHEARRVIASIRMVFAVISLTLEIRDLGFPMEIQVDRPIENCKEGWPRFYLFERSADNVIVGIMQEDGTKTHSYASSRKMLKELMQLAVQTHEEAGSIKMH